MKRDPAWELALDRVQKAKGGAPADLASKDLPANFRDFWLAQTMGGGGSLPEPKKSESAMGCCEMSEEMAMPKIMMTMMPKDSGAPLHPSLKEMTPKMPKMGRLKR